jgi:hypothetical protein
MVGVVNISLKDVNNFDINIKKQYINIKISLKKWVIPTIHHMVMN